MTANGSQPIFSIPIEVLGQIFSECIEGDHMPRDSKWPVKVSDGTSFNSFTLGHVCSSWRVIANGLPSLWSKIYICDPHPSHMDAIKTWLRRSQEHELTIHLRAKNVHSLPTFLEVARLLTRVSVRWRDIDLDVPLVALPALNQILLEAPRPVNLKAATLSVDKSFLPPPWEENDDHETDIWSSFYLSPAFREVIWRDLGEERKSVPFYSDVWSYFYSSPSLRSVIWYDPGAARKSVPFHQITELCIHFTIATMDIVFDILLKCSNLEYLTTSTISAHPHLPPPIQLTLPSLHHMDIASHVSLEPLLARLSVPSLKLLHLGFLGVGRVLDGPKTVLDLLSRSKCQVSTFRIMDNDLTSELLHQYLSIPHLSTLTKLDIYGPVCTPTLKLLGQKNQNSFFIMPELVGLSVFCDEVMDGTIEELVRSRWRNVYDCSTDRKKGTISFYEERDDAIGPMDRAFLSRMYAECMY